MSTSAIPAAPTVPAEPTATQLRSTARWMRRLSPADQPGYARPALLAIAAVAGVLYFWGIGRSQYHGFYADAVRSMTESWKAFVYGSFDPANSITLDKLPGFLWPQALSARLLGFHPWSLTLPQALEGVLAVLVLYRVVRRWAGADAALVAAAAFTLTPVVAGLFRTTVEDPAFTLLLLLAADAVQRAAQSARLRSLLLAGVWVGLAFQAKMLEAWAVLPAFGVVYLLAAPVALRRRLGHLALAGLMTVAVSASWVLLASVTPAQDRPYIDGTTDNSAFSMVVGYNFLNRFSSVGLTASDTGSVTSGNGGMWAGGGGGGQGAAAWGGPARGGQTGAAFGASGTGGHASGATGHRSSDATGHHSSTASQGAATASGEAGTQRTGGKDGGWTKMFSTQFAPQTGWLYPLAAISAVCGLAWRRREPRGDRLRAGYLLWGCWLATFFLVFSAGSVGGHSYYMGVIATPLAALSGAGSVLLWRAFRAGGARAWALPTAVAATVAWAAYLAWQFPTFLPWLAPTVIALGVLALALLGTARTGATGRAAARLGGAGLARAGLLAGLLAMLVGPAAWASSVLDPAYGNSGMGTVGPSVRENSAHPGAPATGGTSRKGNRPMPGFGGGSRLTAAQQRLFDYVQANDRGARYLFATTSWSASSPYILATGDEVLPMGGFTGRVPSPTLDQVQRLVGTGQLRYILEPGQESGDGGPRGAGAATATEAAGTDATTGPTAISAWARISCTAVPPDQYGGSADSPAGQVLFDCAH